MSVEVKVEDRALLAAVASALRADDEVSAVYMLACARTEAERDGYRKAFDSVIKAAVDYEARHADPYTMHGGRFYVAAEVVRTWRHHAITMLNVVRAYKIAMKAAGMPEGEG